MCPRAVIPFICRQHSKNSRSSLDVLHVAVGKGRKEEEEGWRHSEPNRAAQGEKLPIQSADHRGSITNTYNY